MDIRDFIKKQDNALKKYRRIYKLLDFSIIALILYTILLLFSVDQLLPLINAFEVRVGTSYDIAGLSINFETAIIAIVSAFFAFILTLMIHIRDKKTSAILLVEDKYPHLREKLRTAYDNLDVDSIIVSDLEEKVLINVSKIDKTADLDERSQDSNAVDTDWKDEEFDISNPAHKEIAFNLLNTIDKKDFTFMSYGFNPISNTPYYKVKVLEDTGEDTKQARVITLGVDKIKGRSNLESIAHTPINRLRTYGGPKGEALADKYDLDIMTKDIPFNYRRNEWDKELKDKYESVMSDKLDRKLYQLSGNNNNYDLNIYREKDGIYKMQVKRSDKSKTSDLKWGEIITNDFINDVKDGKANPQHQKMFIAFSDYIKRKAPDEYEAFVDFSNVNSPNYNEEEALRILDTFANGTNSFFEVTNKQDLFNILQNY